MTLMMKNKSVRVKWAIDRGVKWDRQIVDQVYARLKYNGEQFAYIKRYKVDDKITFEDKHVKEHLEKAIRNTIGDEANLQYIEIQ